MRESSIGKVTRRLATGIMTTGVVLSLVACGGAKAGDADAQADVTEAQGTEKESQGTEGSDSGSQSVADRKTENVSSDDTTGKTTDEKKDAKGLADDMTVDDGSGDAPVTEKDVSEAVDAVSSGLKGVDVGSLRSDDSKLVYQDPTGLSTFVFYYEGDKITREIVYFDYEDTSVAQTAATAMKASESEAVKSVSVDGTQVVVEYDASKFTDLTVSDVKRTYKDLKELT